MPIAVYIPSEVIDSHPAVVAGSNSLPGCSKGVSTTKTNVVDTPLVVATQASSPESPPKAPVCNRLAGDRNGH